MSPKTAKRIAWIGIALTIAMILSAGIILFVLSGTPQGGVTAEVLSKDFYTYVAPLTLAIYLFLSVLILNRNPFHIIGWLFLLVGFFIGTQLVGLALTQLEAEQTSVLARAVEVLSGDIWIPSYIIPLTLVLLYFPDGRLPSRRWWPVALISILGMAAFYMGFILHPWPWPEENILECCNPLAVDWGEVFFNILNIASGIFLASGIIGSVGAVVSRYRKSRGQERAQMKWLVYTAGLLLGLSILMNVLGLGDAPVFGIFFLSMPVILASAMGVAILRYRLFDIDLIIRRTLQYALLTGVLALLYYGGIILLQNFLGTLTGETESPLIIVMLTLGLAALFNPLRMRVQNFIDQRFYRTKYDAEQALADFSQTTRDEVDIGALSERLLQVVGETMQPEKAQLLLNTEGDRRNDR